MMGFAAKKANDKKPKAASEEEKAKVH